MRDMVPSSFMISQMTAAGLSPARRARSTDPSVCPARTRTPPGRARSGNTWPGRTRSVGFAPSATAVRMVWARSLALIPVLTPRAASMETVKAVPKLDAFCPSGTMSGRSSERAFSSVMARQMRPRPYFAMKFTAAAVTFSAATQRSPSFSRSSSSTRMIIFPSRNASRAASIRSTACSECRIISPPRRIPSPSTNPP